MDAPATDLARLGWDDSWREAASVYAEVGQAGRVIRVDRGLSTVMTRGGLVRASMGGAVLDAAATEPTAAPCTGDWVIVRTWPDGPLTVEVVLPRRTAVVRAEPSGSSKGQVLAANADLVAVVVGLHPEPNLARVERLLAIAAGSGGTALVVLTKVDLVGDAAEVAEDITAMAPGIDVIAVSTRTGDGLADLRLRVPAGVTLALIGASGHGKSSLTNALVGADTLATRRIRDDGKGRHTSVRRELLMLPSGGCVIDTPGLRGVGLQGGDGGVAVLFTDIEALAADCRFRDCAHDQEPGCAVRAAVDAGRLDERRLARWRVLHGESASMASRQAARRNAAPRTKYASKQQNAQVRELKRNGLT